MLLADTPLAHWMHDHGYNTSSLAREFNVKRLRVQHWVHRRAFPQGELLIKLIRKTGLTAEDFLPVNRLPQDQPARKRARKAA